ncbi:MAG TPA: hypothetical protein VL003_10740 [Pusillimonas sp.]|uniref:hypothetical protein n=1 Tax=Pusillimonas sp. TaxID=3040095 RepID=UPI002C75957D|nr:hypothetical protein [Pusillimonas sp.]HUH88506.1 hypothetical protein [Pusillimonas sp.]
MRSGIFFLVSLGLASAFVLSGCGKAGIDKNIVTDSEANYQKTLSAAWASMTPAQQEAYNWAVRNFTLEQLTATYSTITPRKLIENEAEYSIKRHSAEIGESTKGLAKHAQRWAQEEQQVESATTELNKITFTPIGFVRNRFSGKMDFEYMVRNGSTYDVSFLAFDAWVLVDAEEGAGRHCRVLGVFAHRGGLPSGKTLKTSFEPGFECRAWRTPEVQNAHNLSYRFEVDVNSVKDFGERKILPELTRPLRSDFERTIKHSEEAIAAAMRAKASLTASAGAAPAPQG